MVAPLMALAGADDRILVGAETGDDAGVFRLDDTSLVATVDFITPVCDDPSRSAASPPPTRSPTSGRWAAARCSRSTCVAFRRRFPKKS